MSETPEQTPTLVSSNTGRDAHPLPVPVMASLLIEIHAGLMADERLQHLAPDLEAIIYEVIAAAGRGKMGSFPSGSTLRLVKTDT